MKLTRKQAIEISIELWAWLAETGNDDKSDWDGWNNYKDMVSDCALCQYREEHSKAKDPDCCRVCPYYQKFGKCWNFSISSPTIYDRWEDAPTVQKHKKYAREFLEQLRQL